MKLFEVGAIKYERQAPVDFSAASRHRPETGVPEEHQPEMCLLRSLEVPDTKSLPSGCES